MNKAKSYYETDKNGNEWFITIEPNGEKTYILIKGNNDEDDEYDSFRCGNVENGKY